MLQKVLIADDEDQIRLLLKRFLGKEGYGVIEAASGQEAIEKAKKESPLAILLDFRMPGIDGVETCRRLKSDITTRLIPIIMITAFEDSKLDALEAGAEDFLTKPFDMVELSIRLKSILRIRHMSVEMDRIVAYIKELKKNFPHLE